MRLVPLLLLVLSCLVVIVSASPVPDSGPSKRGIGSPHDLEQRGLRSKMRTTINKMKKSHNTVSLRFSLNGVRQPLELNLRTISYRPPEDVVPAELYKVVSEGEYKDLIVCHFNTERQLKNFEIFHSSDLIAKARPYYALTNWKAKRWLSRLPKLPKQKSNRT